MSTDNLERKAELARLESYAHQIWNVFGHFYKIQAQLIFNAGGPDKMDAEFYSRLEKQKQQVIEQTIAIIEEASK